MTQKRKLQVFISSTFADLKAERQAAVEAILQNACEHGEARCLRVLR
jgi:hypothetical protein